MKRQPSRRTVAEREGPKHDGLLFYRRSDTQTGLDDRLVQTLI